MVKTITQCLEFIGKGVGGTLDNQYVKSTDALNLALLTRATMIVKQIYKKFGNATFQSVIKDMKLRRTGTDLYITYDEGNDSFSLKITYGSVIFDKVSKNMEFDQMEVKSMVMTVLNDLIISEIEPWDMTDLFSISMNYDWNKDPRRPVRLLTLSAI